MPELVELGREALLAPQFHPELFAVGEIVQSAEQGSAVDQKVLPERKPPKRFMR